MNSLESALLSTIEAGLLEALSTEELGAMIRLKVVEARAGQLPSEDVLLARLARLSDERWDAVKPMVARGFGPGFSSARPLPDVPTVAVASPSSELEKRRAQTAAATAARLSKSRDGPDKRTFPDVGQRFEPSTTANVDLTSKNVVSTSPNVVLVSLDRSVAPAQQRSEPISKTLSAAAQAQSASNVDSTSKNVPQRSNVPGDVAALRKISDRQWCEQLLKRAYFPWAAEDRRAIPVDLANRLSTHPNASPCRIAFALQQIAGMGSRSKPDMTPPNPLALLIAALGAQEIDPKDPWEVPLGFLPVFEHMSRERETLLSAQSKIDSARQRLGSGVRSQVAGSSVPST